MRILLDTNIALDIALKRKPHIENIRLILNSADQNQFEFYVTSVSITDIHYVLSREVGKTKSLMFLKDWISKVGVCLSDKQVILSALQSSFKDFEDAVQYFSAVNSNLEVIVTRNEKDFKLATQIQVLNPEQFVRKYLAHSFNQSETE